MHPAGLARPGPTQPMPVPGRRSGPCRLSAPRHPQPPRPGPGRTPEFPPVPRAPLMSDSARTSLGAGGHSPCGGPAARAQAGHCSTARSGPHLRQGPPLLTHTRAPAGGQVALGAEVASGMGVGVVPPRKWAKSLPFLGLSLPALGGPGLSDLEASGCKPEGGWCAALQRQEGGAAGTPGCARLTAGTRLGISEAPEPPAQGRADQSTLLRGSR